MSYKYSFAPASAKQALYLKSEATITVYGGAMGSGKTYNGLLKHLRWINDPHYRGVVYRRNSSTIMKSGGLFDGAKGLYRAFEPRVKVNLKAQKFTFPSGAEIVFTHLETDDDAENQRGFEFSHAMFDEATQLKEDHVLVVLSRLRSKAQMVPCMGLTCNPDPDSFLRRWVDWYLYPEGHEFAGRPDPEKDGVVRWFLRLENEMIWSDTRQELFDRYKNNDLPDDHSEQPLPLSFTFISANIFDNPPLLKLNPQYLANLRGLKRVKQERDLWGNWNIREDISSYWQAEWCEEVYDLPPVKDVIRTVRAYDIAGSRKSETNPNPDYTTSVKMSLLRNGNYFIEEVTRMRGTYHEVFKHIIDNAKRDGSKVDIIIPQDAGAAGKHSSAALQKDIADYGYFSKRRPTNKSKLERFRPFCASSESGAVSILKNCGTDFENKIYNDNGFFYAELETFTNTRNQKDDLVDAVGDAFMTLAQRINIPNFLAGMKSVNLTAANPLNQF